MEQNVETDSAATTGGQGNLKYFMNVPWPPVETALSIYNVSIFVRKKSREAINPLNPELNSICCLLALLGAHHFLHVSRIRVKPLTLRVLMPYIYMQHPFLMFLDHTQRRTTVGRTPLDE